MVLNIELLEGAIIEFKGVFYVAAVEDYTLTIKELFTGLRVQGSELEQEVLRAYFEAIKQQTNEAQ